MDYKINEMSLKVYGPDNDMLLDIPTQTSNDSDSFSGNSRFNVKLYAYGLPIKTAGDYNIVLTTEKEEATVTFTVQHHPPDTEA